jgi:hypothetical protein
MAGENIAAALIAMIKGQDRPRYLCPNNAGGQPGEKVTVSELCFFRINGTL